MEVFNLNIIPGAVAPIIHASQYDDGREFRANLFEGPSVYTLTGAETITINVRKPDGNVVTAAVTNTADSYVEFATTEQMTACSGANLCELKFENSPVKIGSLNFILLVEADPLEGGIQSESAIHDLQAQIAAAVAEQYDAADVIFDAAPTPGHGVGYAVTSEGVAAAVQDAKDYTDTAIGGLSIPENITDLADTDINNPTNGEILVYNNGSWENQANPSSTTNFAPDYDDTATYNTNDKVIYQGLLYVCLEDSVTGAWDSTKWQNISVADYNAELLPIQSGSSTNTKAYIDSGLSGKADTSDTYTKTEVDNIVAGRKCSTYSLVTTSTLTGTETTFNTFSGRKFSDYDLYIFTFGESATYMRRTAIVTKSQWVSGASVSEGVLHGSGSASASAYSYCGMVISYNSDTSVKGKVLGSEAIDKFSIIGIKY